MSHEKSPSLWLPDKHTSADLLGPEGLETAKKTMCEDAYNLLVLAYETRKKKDEELPPPPHQTIDISPLIIISLEGVNCCGKTTQVKKLAEIFKAKDPIVPPRFYDCVATQIIQSQSQGLFYQMFDPITDSLIIASAYVEKFNRLLQQERHLVITDRSAESLYTFQGRKLIRPNRPLETNIQWLMDLIKNVDRADFRFFLNVPIDLACQRSVERDTKTGRPSLSTQDVKELSESMATYELLRNKLGRKYILIDGALTEDEVTQKIIHHINL